MIERTTAKASPGQLDQRIQVWRFVYVPDGGGGSTGVPTLVATVWARAIARSVREINDQDQLRETAYVQFTIRNRQDMTADDWIVWRGVRHNIRGFLQNGPRDLYLDIDAERGVAI